MGTLPVGAFGAAANEIREKKKKKNEEVSDGPHIQIEKQFSALPPSAGHHDHCNHLRSTSGSKELREKSLLKLKKTSA